LTVNYGIAGTANSADYTGATPGTGKTITFAAGSSTATLTIDPTADTTVESNETVVLTLTSGTGYTVGTTTAVTGTITNDDVALPGVTLAVSPSSVLENGVTNLIYTFTRTGATTNALTVNYGIAGTATFNNDYTQIGAASFTATTGTITFAAGSSTKTLTIDPTADTTVESNETVAVTLATGTGYTVGTTTAVTGTITNDDIASPSITLAVSPSSVTEDGTANLIYTFTRTGATTNALTINYNVAGTATFNNDYTQIGAASFTATTGTITFAAGSSTKTLTIDPTADTTVESNETVAVTLATGTGYTVGTTTAVTGTITNDDIASPSITLAVSPSSVTEDGTANLIYTFTRTGATTNALTINYNVAGTATFNNDYTQIGAASFTATTGTITFAAGSSTKTLTIDPTADTTVESNETVALTLATGTGYTIGTTTAVTGTITNDDTAGPLTLTGDATNNNLVGGSGNDTFLGLGGQDTLTGGLGADRFRFNSPIEGMDTITDFSKTQGDKIELFGTGFNSLVWTDGVSNALAPSVFSMGTSANSWTNSIIYNNSNGIVYFDADALGSGSQVALAQLSPGLNLTNQDFIVSWV
jgi:Ca2+-binding RTX toxin-like protein